MYTWGQNEQGQLGLGGVVVLSQDAMDARGNVSIPQKVRFHRMSSTSEEQQDDDAGEAFVFSITAAGWHTGALVLGEPDRAAAGSAPAVAEDSQDESGRHGIMGVDGVVGSLERRGGPAKIGSRAFPHRMEHGVHLPGSALDHRSESSGNQPVGDRSTPAQWSHEIGTARDDDHVGGPRAANSRDAAPLDGDSPGILRGMPHFRIGFAGRGAHIRPPALSRPGFAPRGNWGIGPVMPDGADVHGGVEPLPVRGSGSETAATLTESQGLSETTDQPSAEQSPVEGIGGGTTGQAQQGPVIHRGGGMRLHRPDDGLGDRSDI